MLLNIILYAYSRGGLSSRRIAEACRTHITFIVVSRHPAALYRHRLFVRTDRRVVSKRILLVCDELGLIGKEVFAIDGRVETNTKIK